MVAKKRTKRAPTPEPEPRRFVVMPASVVKFRHIEAMNGTLYGLDEEGQVFAYVPSSEAWVRLDGDDNRVIVLPNPEDAPKPNLDKLPENIQQERAEREEKQTERRRQGQLFADVYDILERSAILRRVSNLEDVGGRVRVIEKMLKELVERKP